METRKDARTEGCRTDERENLGGKEGMKSQDEVIIPVKS